MPRGISQFEGRNKKHNEHINNKNNIIKTAWDTQTRVPVLFLLLYLKAPIVNQSSYYDEGIYIGADSIEDGTPWVEEQQTIIWPNYTDSHESAHKTITHTKKVEAKYNHFFWRFAPDVLPHFQIRSGASERVNVRQHSALENILT